MNKADIRSMTTEMAEQFAVQIGEKPFRGRQIFEWVNKKQADSFGQMTNLSKQLRDKLDETAYISSIKLHNKLVSKIDGTIKYLFILENDTIIESVLMRYGYGNAVCISSQAGCRMGCKFCASTLNGLGRNLTAGEYVSQIAYIQKDIGERISNIVVMGSGEPFENYDNTLKFISIVNDKAGLDIGQRHITVSTCGLVDKILDFADLGLQVNLAVSLHAPNDTIRKQLMPVAKRYRIDEIIDSCKYYAKTTKRRVTYEYALVQGVNDSLECAKELGSRLRHTLCHVNLIPVNNVAERDLKGSTKDVAEVFIQTLQGFGIEATLRRTLGADINASCGQLRNSVL